MSLNKSSAKVGCAGILVADTFCGPMDSIPREGQLLAIDSIPSKAGGCAANVSIDLIKQGISVEVCGCLGKDSSAQVVLNGLSENGVDCQHIVVSPNLPTSKTIILLVKGQDRRYIHSFGANVAFSISDLDVEWLHSLSIFYLGGLFLLPGIDPLELASLLHTCRVHGVITVLDVVIPQNSILPNSLTQLLQEVDYFLPNAEEAAFITGENDPMAMFRRILSFGAKNVLVTLGNHGIIAGNQQQCWQVGSYPMNCVDPSGSGDAFTAGVITSIVHGWDFPRLLKFSSALGASAVRALGTTDGVFTIHEADSFIQQYPLSLMRIS